jgi:hypothetical protein
LTLTISDDDDPIGVDSTFTTPFFQTLCAPAAADYNPEDYFAHNDVAGRTVQRRIIE